MPDRTANRDWPDQGRDSAECAAASLAAILNLPRTICECIGDFARTDPDLAAVIVVFSVWIVLSIRGVC